MLTMKTLQQYRIKSALMKNVYLRLFSGIFLAFIVLFSIIDKTGKDPNYLSAQYRLINISKISTGMVGFLSPSLTPNILSALTDWNKETFWLGAVKPNVDNSIVIETEKPEIISKISIGFGLGRSPLDYCLIGYYNSSVTLNQCFKNNHKEWLIYYPPQTVTLSKLEIIFNKTTSDDGLQQISEVALFKAVTNNLLVRTIDKIFRHDRSFPSYIYYVGLFTLITTLVGSVVVQGVSKYISPGERMVWVFMWGTVLLGAIGTIAIAVPPWVDRRTMTVILVAVLLCYSIVFRTYRSIKVDFKLLGLIILYATFLVGFFYVFDRRQLNRVESFDHLYDDTSYYSIPYGSFEQDFETPYGEAKILLYDIPYNTPITIAH